LQCL